MNVPFLASRDPDDRTFVQRISQEWNETLAELRLFLPDIDAPDFFEGRMQAVAYVLYQSLVVHHDKLPSRIELLVEHIPGMDMPHVVCEMLLVERGVREKTDAKLDAAELCRRFPQFFVKQSVACALLTRGSAISSNMGFPQELVPLFAIHTGSSQVIAAVDVTLAQPASIAVKLLPQSDWATAEETTLKKIGGHPNIVEFRDSYEAEGRKLLAFEWVDNDLHRLVRGLRDRGEFLNAYDAVRIVRDAARAVHFAHEKGVIHHDLKPANVLVDDGLVVKVADFGLARRDDSSTRTGSGNMKGTYAYMAPEQVWGKGVDRRTDVHALGIILYYTLTGENPFERDTRAGEIDAVRHWQPPPPSRRRRGVDTALDDVCAKCLQKNPAHRYKTAAAFADELDAYLNGQPISAPRITMARRAVGWCQRNPRPTAVIAILLVLSIGLTCSLFQSDQYRRSLVSALGNERVARQRADDLANSERVHRQRAVKSAELADAQRRRAMAATVSSFGLLEMLLFDVPAKPLLLSARHHNSHEKVLNEMTAQAERLAAFEESSPLDFPIKPMRLLALANIECRRGDSETALRHIQAALDADAALYSNITGLSFGYREQQALMYQTAAAFAINIAGDGAADALAGRAIRVANAAVKWPCRTDVDVGVLSAIATWAQIAAARALTDESQAVGLEIARKCIDAAGRLWQIVEGAPVQRALGAPIRTPIASFHLLRWKFLLATHRLEEARDAVLCASTYIAEGGSAGNDAEPSGGNSVLAAPAVVQAWTRLLRSAYNRSGSLSEPSRELVLLHETSIDLTRLSSIDARRARPEIVDRVRGDADELNKLRGDDALALYICAELYAFCGFNSLIVLKNNDHRDATAAWETLKKAVARNGLSGRPVASWPALLSQSEALRMLMIIDRFGFADCLLHLDSKELEF